MATPTTLPATFVAGNVLTAAQMNDLRGAFRVLQVVSTTKTDTFSTTSTTFTSVTGLSATITPSSADSKVLISVQASVGNSAATAVYFRMTGGNTGSYLGDTAGNRTRSVGQVFVASATQGEMIPLLYLDSPATTSATTYQLQMAAVSGNTAYINRQGTDTDVAGTFRWASTITVMEISA